MDFHAVKIGKKYPKILNVIIEIPKGGHNKYEFDEETGLIKLDRVLHSPLFYPAEYGFVPETAAPDGDHLDVLVITNSPTFPGCLMEVRPLGVMRMVDEDGQDDKLIAVPVHNPYYKQFKKLSDVQAHFLDEVTHFFEQYKTLERKNVTVKGYGQLPEAEKLIKKCHQAYIDKQKIG